MLASLQFTFTICSNPEIPMQRSNKLTFHSDYFLPRHMVPQHKKAVTVRPLGTLRLKKDTGPAASLQSLPCTHLSSQRERSIGPSFVRVTERGGGPAAVIASFSTDNRRRHTQHSHLMRNTSDLSTRPLQGHLT